MVAGLTTIAELQAQDGGTYEEETMALVGEEANELGVGKDKDILQEEDTSCEYIIITIIVALADTTFTKKYE